MKKSQILNILTEIYRKELDNSELILTNEFSPNQLDNWDSMTHMIIISEVENTFNIKFKMRELTRLQNVGILVELIQNRISI